MALSAGSLPPAEPTPLIHRRSFRRLFTQGIYVAITAVVIAYVIDSLDLREFGFGYLNEPLGLAVGSQWLTDVDGVTNSRITMYFVAVWGSLRVIFVSIVLASLLGVLAGVGRLSSNWIVARMSTLFVEIFRNTPLLVQCIIWYAILSFGLPQIQEVVNIGDSFFLSNRGVAVPWPVPSGGFVGSPDWFVGVWVAILIVLALVAQRVRAQRQAKERETGQTQFANRWAFGIFGTGALVSFFVLGAPVAMDVPFVQGTDYTEGMVIKPEFGALVAGLTFYTGAFIAEIVRGAIQALPKGQTEAASALGLSGYQRLTLIILPQALRQIIPSVTNQYLNVNKNSSLAYAVLYDDLFRVATVISNKAGHALEMFIVIILTYMAISVIISVVMNFFNSRVTSHEI